MTATASTNSTSEASPLLPNIVSDIEYVNAVDGLTEDVKIPSPKHILWKVELVDRVFDDVNRATYPNPLSLKPNTPTSWFVDDDDLVAAKVNVAASDTDLDKGIKAEAYTLAGPRFDIAFDPKQCKAAVVTCGGLCPGLNTVVREIVMCLRRQYGVSTTYGIPSGYRGFKDPTTWIPLDEKVVRNFHNMGGSFLGSSRGGHDTKAIVDSLEKEGINLLFVTGGDGTVRGAALIADEVRNRGLEIAVAVIPKTIDNDIPLIDRTFGFESAVNAARQAIDVAVTEAEGFPYGLGIVKVMGRHSGFIAMHSTLGSRVVDLCLVPEVDFYLDGEGGIVDHLADRLLENGNAIVVVAEGAGQELMATMGSHGADEVDLSGNKLLDDVGPWLVKQLKPRLNEKLKGKTPYDDGVTCKYVDPSYMVRGIPPTTADNLFCTQLAHNAVHGAMAGMTSFLVGSVNTRECYLPIRLVANKQNVIDTAHQSLWEYVVFDTQQPSFAVENDCRDENDIITTASGGVIFRNSDDECSI
ncbi:unnamed protein product [Cylindrotheca closterium]|uniref:Phosphofructokinase domain-containing protein n=1 Tax=Cylindrotheca closterium TaxID=2856 RepID=A0AAD2CKE3_9STRA|nr:unnamed protein product [Cylindrotheca closterium]